MRWNPRHHRRDRSPKGLTRIMIFPARCFLGTITLLLLLAIPTIGPARDRGVSWSNLNSREQKVLQPYSKRWDRLSPNQQERLQRGAKEWIDMDPRERERIRARYERFRQLPPDEQQRLRRTRRWYRSLPPKERETLKKRWQNRAPR